MAIKGFILLLSKNMDTLGLIFHLFCMAIRGLKLLFSMNMDTLGFILAQAALRLSFVLYSNQGL